MGDFCSTADYSVVTDTPHLYAALSELKTAASIKLLLKENPDAVKMKDSRGRLPLHIACNVSDMVINTFYILDITT